MSISARDLINVGIFAALYIAVLFGVGMLGVLNPVMMFVSLLGTVLVNGVVFMLFLTRVRRPGLILLFTAVVALFMLLTGHPLVAFVLHLALGAVAEAIWRAGNYTKANHGVLAYATYCLWYVGPLLPIIYAKDAYFADLAKQMNNQAYADGLRDLTTTPVLLGFAVACFVLGLLGGWAGKAMLRKHFTRAGLA